MRSFLLITGLMIVTVVINSCRKDSTDFSADPLTFSADTIIFDTIFTTVGSTTKNFLIYNNSIQTIKIQKIKLTGPYANKFRINVDGLPSPISEEIVILAKDSVWVFVEVTLDQSGNNLPLIITSQIVMESSVGSHSVELVAWGQDAHFHVADQPRIPGLPPYSLAGNATWTNDKPHLIYNYLVVDEFMTLNILAGVQIYLHANAGIWVYQGGRIRVLGTVEEPVVFQGDRLESFYDDVAGQWDRIWINEGSADNLLRNVIIKNAYIGIQAETLPFNASTALSSNRLRLENVVIENCAGLGILARNFQISAQNLLVSNCGNYCFAVSGGGIYDFNHCTFANYWSASTRTTPAVMLVNYYTDINQNIQVRDISSCDFKNCIVYGSQESEFDFDKYSVGAINFRFDHSLVKTDLVTTDTAFYSSSLVNPASVDIFSGTVDRNFHLLSGSPAINIGSAIHSAAVPLDLDDKSRTIDGTPDAGAYEFE